MRYIQAHHQTQDQLKQGFVAWDCGIPQRLVRAQADNPDTGLHDAELSTDPTVDWRARDRQERGHGWDDRFAAALDWAGSDGTPVRVTHYALGLHRRAGGFALSAALRPAERDAADLACEIRPSSVYRSLAVQVFAVFTF